MELSEEKLKKSDIPENIPQDPPPDTTKTTEAAPSHSRRKKMIAWLTVVIVLLLIAWFLLWFFYLQFHETTEDAYANGNLITINAAVPGSCIAFFADDTDLVEKGQLLVLLDSTPYQIAYEKELATLASETLRVRELYSTVEVNRANVSKRVDQCFAVIKIIERFLIGYPFSLSRLEIFHHARHGGAVAGH